MVSETGGARNVTKSGNGTLVLADAGNSYSGATTVNAGVLSVADVADNGSPSGLGQGTSLVLGGGTLRFTGAGADATNRAITLTANSTVQVTGAAGESHAPRRDRRRRRLVCAHEDRQQYRPADVSGANTFNGNVTISNGGLVVTNSNALGTGTKTVVATNGTAGNCHIRLDSMGGADIVLPASHLVPDEQRLGHRQWQHQ